MALAGTQSIWDAMLTKWQTDPDIQEAERGLFALAWTSSPSLSQQTLDISLRDDKVLSRSPANSLAAMLRNVGSNPGNGEFLGSDVAWQWFQGNYKKGNPSM